MSEISARPPEIQTTIARPLDVSEVLYKYRRRTRGEIVGEDEVEPGWGALPDQAPASVVYDALRAAVASFGVTGDKAERLRIWLQNNLTPEGWFIDKAEMDRRAERAIEAERAAHPGKTGKDFDESSYALANGGEAAAMR